VPMSRQLQSWNIHQAPRKLGPNWLELVQQLQFSAITKIGIWALENMVHDLFVLGLFFPGLFLYIRLGTTREEVRVPNDNCNLSTGYTWLPESRVDRPF
jgi:hypothetical protein